MGAEKIKINCVIGIDPGAAGGIAVFVPGEKVKTVKMPKDVRDLNTLIAHYAANYDPIVFLEKLCVRPDDVRVEGDRASLGKLYRIQRMMANYEHLKAIIEANEIPYVMIHPASWQAKLKLRERGEHEEKAERKRRYREQAAKLYPFAKATLWSADALLIMHFGRWALANDLKWVRANMPAREYDKLF